MILFSTADWDNPFWTNKQHTAVQLAERGFRVLYIESLGLRQPQLKTSDLSRILKRLCKFFRGAKKVRPNLYVYSPLVIPFHRFSWVRRVNQILLQSYLRYFQKKLRFQNPMVWTYNPMVLDLIRRLHPQKIVYHSVDDLSASPGVDARSILEHEDELLRNADAVFCTSRKIENRCRKIAGNKVHYFGNVVDYEHFSKAKSALSEPDSLRSIPHPRIGFVGAMSEYKVDVKTIQEVALAQPQWHWVMIGKVGEGQPGSQLEKLAHLPNLHFLGPKNYEDLPAYLRAFDLTIIPSPLNEYTRSMFPMKFFEYMAAGKPIVASCLDALKEYQDYFYVYATPSDLIEQIHQALKLGVKDPMKSEQLALENTWEKRLVKMLAILGVSSIQ